MFDYDRLSLDVAQQFAANQKGTENEDKCFKDSLSTGSSESQLFDWESPSPPAQPEVENAIVNGLSELLRRCSSPGHQNLNQQQNNGQQYQRHRSATISNEQIFHNNTMISPKQSVPQRHNTIGNALSMDLAEQQKTDRRLSGGSVAMAEMFDCGASSGYGSPGAVGTPLASPAGPNSAVQFIAHQLHKMFAEQGLCDGMAALNGTPIKTTNMATAALANGVLPIQITQNGLSTPAVISTTPVLVKATTTTTGTNKNSNKRKTSIVNTDTSPVPDNIIATDDGFGPNEIAEFAELLCSPKRSPPTRYVCHICYQPGHYISDCPQRFNTPYEELTPYQGRKKCYGEFQCEQCKRKWTSQNSVANEAQSCIKCHVPVFPHKQLPVDKAIALGLVKLQRLPVTNVTTTPPTPLSSVPLSCL